MHGRDLVFSWCLLPNAQERLNVPCAGGPAFFPSSPSSLHPAQLHCSPSAHPSALLTSCYSYQGGITARWVLHPTTTLQKKPAATLVYAGGCRHSRMTARSKKSKFKTKDFSLFLSPLKPRSPLHRLRGGKSGTFSGLSVLRSCGAWCCTKKGHGTCLSGFRAYQTDTASVLTLFPDINVRAKGDEPIYQNCT